MCARAHVCRCVRVCVCMCMCVFLMKSCCRVNESIQSVVPYYHSHIAMWHKMRFFCGIQKGHVTNQLIISVYIHTHTCAHTHTYIHTYIHTYTQSVATYQFIQQLLNCQFFHERVDLSSSIHPIGIMTILHNNRE